jgi:hypothetical protein
MALTVRTFVFEALNELKYLPRRVSSGLYAETERLPQYASKSMKTVEVVIESEDRGPSASLTCEATYWPSTTRGGWSATGTAFRVTVMRRIPIGNRMSWTFGRR